ncbi:taurine catabolism dioxygenase TauD [Ramaria rubella]|nr:taurine catabolism dioxygenase TauD [Ramaria rubella]
MTVLTDTPVSGRNDLKQPDIGYHPDETNYKARTARRLAEEPDLHRASLPFGFPSKVEGKIVWEGKDWTREEQWVYQLTPIELDEIANALVHFKSLNIPMGYINKDTFPLPTLGDALKNLAQELYSGRGFFVLRTLPVDTYSRMDIAIVFAGISSHVGSNRGKQDGSGAVLAHIKDLRTSHAHERIGNAAYTTASQVFHTDTGDLIALFALQTAAEGGVSRISSSARVYNELAATRPDLIKTLSEPWPLDRFGGTPACIHRPLLFHEDGHIIIQYSRRQFTGYGDQKRNPDIPPITEAQAEALDAVHFLAQKLSLGLNFQKGDIQYINSLGLLHARDEFRDDAEHTRHLIRLWLQNKELSWKTPSELVPVWNRIYSLGPEEQRFPLEPEIRVKAPGVGM